MPSVGNTLKYIGASWIEEAKPKSATVMAIFVVSAVLYLVLRQIFRVFATARMRRREKPPAFFERATAATWYAPMRAIAPIFAALLLFVGLESLDILHYWRRPGAVGDRQGRADLQRDRCRRRRGDGAAASPTGGSCR